MLLRSLLSPRVLMKSALCLAVALPLHTGLGREPSEHRVTHSHSPHSREQFQIVQPGGENEAPHREAYKGDVPTVLDADLPAPIKSGYKDLQSVGVKPFLDLYGVFLGNPVGGQAHLGKYAQETILGFEFDLEKIVDLEGGRVVTSAGWGYGSQLSQFIPNDIVVNEAYIEASIALFNLYYGQMLMDNRLELRVGRMGSGQLFASLPAFSVQVNGGINGNPNALFENISFYSSAGSTWTGFAKYNPTPASYLSVGIQQAGPDIGSRASHGIDFGIGPNNGVLALFEAGWKRGAHEQASHSASRADRSQQGDGVLPFLVRLAQHRPGGRPDELPVGAHEQRRFGLIRQHLPRSVLPEDQQVLAVGRKTRPRRVQVPAVHR